MRIMNIVFNAFVGLSAMTVGTVGVLSAPAYRRRVAWVLFALGTVLALWIGYSPDVEGPNAGVFKFDWEVPASAIGAGFVGVLVLDYLLRTGRIKNAA
jgi:hypothetical protein